MADTAEARVSDAAEELAVRRAAVARPIDKHRAPDDEVSRDKPPVAAVLALIAAVAHAKEGVLGDLHRLAGHTKFITLTGQMLARFDRIDRLLRVIYVSLLV